MPAGTAGTGGPETLAAERAHLAESRAALRRRAASPASTSRRPAPSRH